ncbi:PREDICTED: golgin subfamily A member 8B-like [Cercocebus atys]|uniref:golgin subfamily A member 8B-like n=1 Tax=Cercocebus atys TaxID=9531 RepID=UPI0005F39981|nr:PREDICTED: golgin subfamily A member 8B-like [Cercocebus atys]
MTATFGRHSNVEVPVSCRPLPAWGRRLTPQILPILPGYPPVTWSHGWACPGALVACWGHVSCCAIAASPSACLAFLPKVQFQTINILVLEKADLKTTVYHTKRAATPFEGESKDLTSHLQYSLQRIGELERAPSAVSMQQQEEDRNSENKSALQLEQQVKELQEKKLSEVKEMVTIQRKGWEARQPALGKGRCEAKGSSSLGAGMPAPFRASPGDCFFFLPSDL